MRPSLTESIRSLAGQANRRLRRTWSHLRGGELSWLAPRDAGREEDYLAALRQGAASDRWQAAAALGRNPLRSPEAVAALVAALADAEEFVRMHAAEALAHQEQGHVFPALVFALSDREPLRRAGAAEALGRLGGEAAAHTLMKHAGDPDPRVRIAVAAALGELKDPTSANALVPLLHDHDGDVIRAAARALGQIANPLAALFLAEALAAPGQSVLVRRSLSAALVHAGHPDTQAQLLAALRDEDPQVRGYAAQALGHFGNETAVEPLGQLRADKHRLLRGTVSDRATQAIELLERRGRRQGQAGDGEPAKDN